MTRYEYDAEAQVWYASPRSAGKVLVSRTWFYTSLLLSSIGVIAILAVLVAS